MGAVFTLEFCVWGLALPTAVVELGWSWSHPGVAKSSAPADVPKTSLHDCVIL